MHGNPRLFLDPLGGEQVGIRKFVFAVAEIIDLQAAFFDQRVQAKINLAEADTQSFCQTPLGKAGVIFQCFEQAVAGGIVEHGVRSANEQRTLQQPWPEAVKRERDWDYSGTTRLDTQKLAHRSHIAVQRGERFVKAQVPFEERLGLLVERKVSERESRLTSSRLRRAKLKLAVVVKTASDNHQLRIGCPIHQSVRVIDAPGPVAG